METAPLERRPSGFLRVGQPQDVVDHSVASGSDEIKIDVTEVLDKSPLREIPIINVGRTRTTTEGQYADTEVNIS